MRDDDDDDGNDRNGVNRGHADVETGAGEAKERQRPRDRLVEILLERASPRFRMQYNQLCK
jgi:hypothetical protein